MWARMYIHFTNGGAHRVALPNPDMHVPGEWLRSDELTRALESERCLSCSEYRDRLRATRTSFLQRVRELQWNKDTLVKTYKADMHKRPLLMSSGRREPSTKKLRGARYSGEWQRLLLRRMLRIMCQPIGRCPTSFLSSWSWRGGMVSALVERTTSRTNVKTSWTWSRDDREIRNDSWMHQSRCARMCLFAAQTNKISCHRTAFLFSLGVQISVRFISFCSKKKKMLRPNKKRSLLRLTWLKFLRAGGRFFYLLKFFYTQIRYANLYFSRAGSSNSGTGSLTARRTSLPE